MVVTLFTTVVLAICALCSPTVNAAVVPSAGRNFPSATPAWPLGYTVPLRGSLTCGLGDNCDISLPPPPPGRSLRYLTMARGVSTYNCTDRDIFRTPILQSQTTTLWDAAPILPHIRNENDFHTLIPQLLAFDYAALKNTSLACIGAVASHQSEYVIDIFDVATFAAQVRDIVNAPVEPSQNLPWAHMTNLDHSWDVYRVETTGGMPSPECGRQNEIVSSDYAAEYWFYH